MQLRTFVVVFLKVFTWWVQLSSVIYCRRFAPVPGIDSECGICCALALPQLTMQVVLSRYLGFVAASLMLN